MSVTAPTRTVQPRNPIGQRWRISEAMVFGTLRRLVLTGLVVFTLFPFLYLVALSVRPLGSVIADPLRILPTVNELNLDTYLLAFSSGRGGLDLGRLLINSGIVVVGTVIVALVLSTFGAYAVARLAFPGRTLVSTTLLSVYLFPPMVLAIPLFAIFSRLGLRGSLAGLMVIYFAQTVPVALLMLRNSFKALPREVEEAAEVDGCTRFGLIWRVVLPMSRPALVATGLYVGIIAWNEFLFAFLMLFGERSNWTASVGLAMASPENVSQTTLLAACVLMTLPVAVLFVAGQRVFVEGITAGAGK